MIDRGKTIGDLLVKIEADTRGVDKNLNNVSKALEKVATAFDNVAKTNLSGVTQKLNTMAKAINKFTGSISDDTTKKAKELGYAISSIGNGIKTIGNIGKIDFDVVSKGFQNLSQSIEPFLLKLEKNKEALSNLSTTMKISDSNLNLKKQDLLNEKILTEMSRREQVNKTTEKRQELLNEKILTEDARRQRVYNSIRKSNRALKTVEDTQQRVNLKTKFWNTLWKVGKIAFAVRVVRRFAQSLANIVTTAVEYNESLNKFQNAMQTAYPQAIKFANQMAESFGLAKETILDYQSTFMNMLNSLEGLDINTSEKMSELLTQMAVDYSSLYNTSIESAMEAFQSMLAGRTTAIRSASGIDVTDQTIYSIYEKMGGTKTLNGLSILEKRMLRILAVYQQMSRSQALGDYADTVTEVSNQQRILSEQLKELKTWVGNAFMPMLKQILPILNGVVIALKYIAQSISYLNGFVESTTGLESVEGTKDAVDDLNNSLDDTADKLGLLSFDKFNVLGTSKGEESTDLDLIQSELLKAIDDMNANMDRMSLKAKEIADSILTWIGYSKQVNEETGEVYYTLENGYWKLTAIKILLETIATLVTIKIFSVVISGITVINGKLGVTTTLLTQISTISIIAGIFMLIEGIRQGNVALTMVGVTLLSILATLKVINLLKTTTLGKDLLLYLVTLTARLATVQQVLLGISAGLALIGVAIYIFMYMDDWSASTQRLVGVLGTLTSALIAGATAWLLFQTTMTAGVAVPIIVGAMIMGVASITALTKGIKQYKDGGMPEQGELFIARENGAELVGSMNGHTTVANNQQITDGIRQASYEGFKMAMSENGGSTQKIEIDGSKVSDSAFVRAILPALRVEQARTSRG